MWMGKTYSEDKQHRTICHFWDNGWSWAPGNSLAQQSGERSSVRAVGCNNKHYNMYTVISVWLESVCSKIPATQSPHPTVLLPHQFEQVQKAKSLLALILAPYQSHFPRLPKKFSLVFQNVCNWIVLCFCSVLLSGTSRYKRTIWSLNTVIMIVRLQQRRNLIFFSFGCFKPIS